MTSPSWCPAEGAVAGDDLYLQADLHDRTRITGLHVQGRYWTKAWGWVKTFRVEVYDVHSAKQWRRVNQTAFSGPSSQYCDDLTEVKFSSPIDGSKLRIFPLTWGGNHPSMRVGVKGMALVVAGSTHVGL